MKSNLKIFTSYVNEDNLKKIVDSGYLPVFAINRINKIDIIKRFSNHPVHFRCLSPSEPLEHAYKKGEMSFEDYEKRYVIEMSKVCYQDLIKKLEYLAEYNNAKGIVIMTLEESAESCYRKALKMILNYSGLLENTIEEYEN